MIDLPIYSHDGKKVDSIQIDPAMLGGEVRCALLKQAYVAVHLNQRQGSARTKSRGAVHGSTRKLYKQKGTGNARAGASRTPIRKGGGVAFAKTRTREDLRSSLPKKMRRLANRNALLAKLVDGEVKCFEHLNFATPKTETFAALLGVVGIDRTCLIVLDAANDGARQSAGNLPYSSTIRVDQLNVFAVLNHRYMVIDRATLTAFIDETCFAKKQEVTS
ncbi:MAG: 50S ribosomal protein L4 [Phycisphaerales bacterium]|nr:50S ribosomal protein L4 [Phycisphaerales bacterium]